MIFFLKEEKKEKPSPWIYFFNVFVYKSQAVTCTENIFDY